MILNSKWINSTDSTEHLDEYDEPEVKQYPNENNNNMPAREDFEQKWQMNQITKQLKSMMEREFVGLKTNLSGEFDERTLRVVKQIEGLVNVTVQKRLETVKAELINEIKNKK